MPDHSWNTGFQMDDGAAAYTEIAGVVKIGGPDLGTDMIDITTLKSANAAKEFMPGLIESGEISLQLLFDVVEATHTGANGLTQVWKQRLKRSFKLIFPDTAQTEWGFSGYVTNAKMNFDNANAVQADVTIKITGLPSGAAF